MFYFGKRSREKLDTCNIDIQKILLLVIEHYDFSVISGNREEQEQNDLYEKGYSKVKYPNSKHNIMPSQAVDIAPYPINWKDSERFYVLAGRIMMMADHLGIKLRFGGDWDSDDDLHDQTFFDLGHFELLIEEKDYV